jgi:hypothetical protein
MYMGARMWSRTARSGGLGLGAVEHGLELAVALGEEGFSGLEAVGAGGGQGDDEAGYGRAVGAGDLSGDVGGEGVQVAVQGAGVGDG